MSFDPQPVKLPVSDTATYDQVSISTSAGEILAADDTRLTYTVQNLGSEDLYIGYSSGVTTGSAGFRIPPGKGISEDGYTGEVWGIVASSGTTVSYTTKS